LSGCLSFLSQNSGVQYFSGLPSKDFHYALLWIYEYDYPREGFPSWSWAGWHTCQAYHVFHPAKNSGLEVHIHHGDHSFAFPTAVIEKPDIEKDDRFSIDLKNIDGTLFKCAHWPAQIFLSSPSEVIISSTWARSRFILTHNETESTESTESINDLPTHLPKFLRNRPVEMFPPEFHSDTHPEVPWEDDTMYHIGYNRWRLLDAFGHLSIPETPHWLAIWLDSKNLSQSQHFPRCTFHFPSLMQGSSIRRILDEGLQLLNIIEIEIVNEKGLTLRMVLCLGIDMVKDSLGVAKRFGGTFWIAKEYWDRLNPSKVTLKLI
jgi:hypothetical protein